MMRPALLAFGLLATPSLAETSLSDAAAGLDLFPCELGTLTCTTITVPLDHRANDPSQTLDITFALSFATEESRGILFYFVGGPGGSGLASADSYLASFDPSLVRNMDIVFMDQRGIGPVHGLACPVAQARFDSFSAPLSDTESLLASARSYVSDCTAEMDADRLLPVVDTDQAIRDVEAFRQAIGAPRVWLYGESYGTQLVQAYATQVPSAVRGVILDGVVDLTLDAESFYRRYTLAAERLLADTFALCSAMPACHADLPEPARVYDDLAARLSVAPIPVAYTLADGSRVDRTLTAGHLEASAFFALYSPEGRAEFLRALAAAGQDNLVPLLQLGYSNLFIDPETEIGMQDPSWFGAAYYAITCTDYDTGPGAPDDRARRILDEARALAPQAPRLLRSYYQERLACAYWPHQGPATRPQPYAGGDWPTLILNGTNDPITPISMAYSVLDNARNAYGVFMQGGPHVIWGRGLPCPDLVVQALLYDGTPPAAREQMCEQDPIADYTPLGPGQPATVDALAAARAVETELRTYIPLLSWDGEHPNAFGCPLGGTFLATPSELGTDFTFTDCRFWRDLPVSGSAVEINADTPDAGITLNLSFSGAQTGELVYHHLNEEQTFSLSGTWNGQPAALPRSPD